MFLCACIKRRADALANPYFFDLRDPDKFLIGINDAGQPSDVPRNAQGQALIADSAIVPNFVPTPLHFRKGPLPRVFFPG